MKMEKADKINRMTHHGAKPKHSDGASWGHQLGSQQLGSGLAIIHAESWTEGRFVTRAHWGASAAALIRLAALYASKIPQILSSRIKNQPSRAKARRSVGRCQG